MKKYTIVAGVNGTGKTTLYQTGQIQKSDFRINVDEIVVEFKMNPRWWTREKYISAVF